MATELIETIARVDGPALVALTFIVVFAESAVLLDLFVPGELGLVLAGAAAEDAGVPLGLVVAAGALGGAAGDSVGFWLGRRYGMPIINRWRVLRRRVAPQARRARRYFERRGGPSVAVARWIGALRAVVPVVAGTAKMRYSAFVAWDFPSVLAWTATVAILGYTLGDDAARGVDRVGTVTSLVVVVVLVGAVLWRRRRATQSGS